MSSYRFSRGCLAIDGDVAAAGIADAEDGTNVGTRTRLSEVLLDEAANVLGHADAQIDGLAFGECIKWRPLIYIVDGVCEGSDKRRCDWSMHDD